MLHNVDRSNVNLLDIEEYTASDNNMAEASAIYEDYEDDENEDKLQKIKDTRIDTLGLYLDTSNMEITLLAVPPQYMTFIQQRTNKDSNGYHISFKDTNGVLNQERKGQVYSTNAYLASSEINTIQELYLQYFKTLA